jgi:hypothetical protein
LLSILAIFAARCLLIILTDEPKPYTAFSPWRLTDPYAATMGFARSRPAMPIGYASLRTAIFGRARAMGFVASTPTDICSARFSSRSGSHLTFGGPSKSGLFTGGTLMRYAIFLNWRGAGWP